MSGVARFAADKTTGKPKQVWYVNIPAKEGPDGKMRPEKAQIGTAYATQFYYPVAGGIQEYIYKLSNEKMINQKALFGTREECEEAVDKMNEELALSSNYSKKIKTSPLTNFSSKELAT